MVWLRLVLEHVSLILMTLRLALLVGLSKTLRLDLETSQKWVIQVNQTLQKVRFVSKDHVLWKAISEIKIKQTRLSKMAGSKAVMLVRSYQMVPSKSLIEPKISLNFLKVNTSLLKNSKVFLSNLSGFSNAGYTEIP